MPKEETKDTKPMNALADEGGETMAELTNASHAHGTVLSMKKSGATEYTKIAHLISVTPPNVTTDEIETTDHDSKGWKEFIAGLKDGGSMPFKLNVFDETGVKELFALAESGEVVEWKIEAPISPKKFEVELKGFLKSFNLDELVSGSAITAAGEIRNSGQPKFGFKA